MVTHNTCQSCGGDCLSWKGSVWGYTCAGCIRHHLEASAARADAKHQKNRERLVSSMKTYSLGRTTPKGGGAPSYVPTAVLRRS